MNDKEQQSQSVPPEDRGLLNSFDNEGIVDLSESGAEQVNGRDPISPEDLAVYRCFVNDGIIKGYPK